MKETNCGEMEAERCLNSSIPVFYTLHPYDKGSLLCGCSCLDATRKRGLSVQQAGGLYCVSRGMFQKGWLMPDVREASVFLEEPDLSVEGGIAQPAKDSRDSPDVWLLKHQVSLGTLTKSSSNTLGLHCEGSCCCKSNVPLQCCSLVVGSVEWFESESDTRTGFVLGWYVQTRRWQQLRHTSTTTALRWSSSPLPILLFLPLGPKLG